MLQNVFCKVLEFRAGNYFEARNIRDSIEMPKKYEYKASDKGRKRRKILKFNKSIKAQNLKDKEDNGMRLVHLTDNASTIENFLTLSDAILL